MNKLIIIANRLPVVIERKEEEFIYKRSVGGLATGMSSLSSGFNCIWIGAANLACETLIETEREIIFHQLKENYQYHPVFLTHEEIKYYYEGFSNETLWPLFHYFPYYARFEDDYWQTYAAVNAKFCSALESIYEEGDLIWVQDYHLTLLPSLIREMFPQARIGFFLHIPFPDYEVFRLLPWRKEVLEGLLGADLLGFHTPSYVQHFLDNVHRLLGYENVFGEIRLPHRTVRVNAYPMGIDYKKFESAGSLAAVRHYLRKNKKIAEKYRLILSVDRLDYSKGILERLKCLEFFLEKYPQYHNKVLCIVVAVPSRTDVKAYVRLNTKVNETVGRINGRYETLGWTPIRYFHRAMDFTELSAFYALCDVALVTPLRDGMNLVAKEYIAARKNGNGVLILSEMAGVAEELGEALIINPYNKEQVADAIKQGLTMSREEQQERIRSMQVRLKKNDVFKWANGIAEDLLYLPADYYNQSPIPIDDDVLRDIKEVYLQASRRLILLDYDGTLVPFKQKPEGNLISKGIKVQIDGFVQKLNLYNKIRDGLMESQLNKLLVALYKDPKNIIAIISGRSKDFLDNKFKNLPLTLAGEHGAWLKYPGMNWRKTLEHEAKWKELIRPLFEFYMDRSPGAIIEEKSFSLAWHYRMVKEPLAQARTRELKSTILSTIANMNLKVLEGDKVIEVKNVEVSKGKIAGQLLAQNQYDFVLAIGDDNTDEEIFGVLPPASFSIKVGKLPSRARYQVDGDADVRRVLAVLGGYEEKQENDDN